MNWGQARRPFDLIETPARKRLREVKDPSDRFMVIRLARKLHPDGFLSDDALESALAAYLGKDGTHLQQVLGPSRA